MPFDNGAALADPALWLAPDKAGLLFAVLFGLGVVIQLAGLWRQSRAVLLAGAAAVFCAALLDHDPVLAVGQTAVTLLLIRRSTTAAREESSPSARTGKTGKMS